MKDPTIKKRKSTSSSTSSSEQPKKRKQASASKTSEAPRAPKAKVVLKRRKDVASKTKPKPAKRKSSKSTSSKKPASRATRTPERVEEIAQITMRAKRNPAITLPLIIMAVKLAARVKSQIANIPNLKDILTEQFEKSKNATESEKDLAKLQTKFDDSIARLDRIKSEAAEAANGYYLLKPSDEIFLKSIHAKKPLTGYMKFAKEHRNIIHANNPDASFGQMGKLMGEAWNNLSAAQRLAYSSSKRSRKVSVRTAVAPQEEEDVTEPEPNMEEEGEPAPVVDISEPAPVEAQ